VVARVGSASLRASDVDRPLRLALHDLEMQKFRLRRRSLEAELLRRLELLPAEERTAAPQLEPPVPPRLSVEPDPARTRPAAEAAVTIVAFCNFESAHCERLQRTLSQVLPLFPGVLRYGERDLPMAFHRHAGQAAEAARCAGQQGNYWRFHDLLYTAAGAPDRAGLERAARGADLDMTAFSACLDDARHRASIEADARAARALGVESVPAVFVNGTYASPDVQPSDLVWLVELELEALGVESPRQLPAATTSTAPFVLRGLLASPVPGQGLALLAPSVAPDRIQAHREGDAVATGLVVRRILPTHLELWHDGRLEKLDWDGPAAAARTEDPDDMDRQAALYPHRATPVTLDRQDVLVRLSDRIALEQALSPVEMTVGAYHLLRVDEVAPGGLYELLGFAPRDVLISVNEQPVHEAANPLWDALEKEGEVRVRVIRSGGLARHFTYRFGD